MHCTQLANEVTASSREKRQALIDKSREREYQDFDSCQGSFSNEGGPAPGIQEDERYEEASLNYKRYLHIHIIGIGWLKQWGVEIASEKKLRAESEQYVGENLYTYRANPIHLSCMSMMVIEIRNVPMAYVKDLWQKIEDMLSMNDNDITGNDACTQVYKSTQV